MDYFAYENFIYVNMCIYVNQALYHQLLEPNLSPAPT